MTTTTPASTARGTSPTRALVVGSAALFTDMLVHGLAVPVLPLLPAVVEQGPAATGILFSSYAVAMIVATLFAGRLVDRHGPRTALLIGLVGLAAATLLFATGGPYWLLLVARFAQGIAGGMSWVAALSLIAATTTFAKRGQAMGIAMSTITLGVLVGPPLAGFLVEHLGTASPFLLAAGVALADGVLRMVLVKDSPRVTDDTAGPLAVLRVPGSLAICLAIAIGAGALSGIEPVLPVHLGGPGRSSSACFSVSPRSPRSSPTPSSAGTPRPPRRVSSSVRVWRPPRSRCWSSAWPVSCGRPASAWVSWASPRPSCWRPRQPSSASRGSDPIHPRSAGRSPSTTLPMPPASLSDRSSWASVCSAPDSRRRWRSPQRSSSSSVSRH